MDSIKYSIFFDKVIKPILIHLITESTVLNATGDPYRNQKRSDESDSDRTEGSGSFDDISDWLETINASSELQAIINAILDNRTLPAVLIQRCSNYLKNTLTPRRELQRLVTALAKAAEKGHLVAQEILVNALDAIPGYYRDECIQWIKSATKENSLTLRIWYNRKDSKNELSPEPTHMATPLSTQPNPVQTH